MRPTGTPAPDAERTLDLMRDVVRQARGAVLWIRDNVFAAADAGVLSVENAQEIWDHADEAEETLLGPLEALYPHLKTLDDEAAAAELERLDERAVPRRSRVRKKALIRRLRETLEEALEHVGVAAPFGVGALSEPATGFSSEQIDELWRDFASAKESVEVALHVLEILGAMAAAAMAHTLLTSIRRRARDLAILRTIGFVGRQVRATVAWQATVLVAVALALGVPVGIGVGRWGWLAFADTLGVVPVLVAPALALALTVPIVIAGGNLVAALPARAAARTKPALVLRSE